MLGIGPMRSHSPPAPDFVDRFVFTSTVSAGMAATNLNELTVARPVPDGVHAGGEDSGRIASTAHPDGGWSASA